MPRRPASAARRSSAPRRNKGGGVAPTMTVIRLLPAVPPSSTALVPYGTRFGNRGFASSGSSGEAIPLGPSRRRRRSSAKPAKRSKPLFGGKRPKRRTGKGLKGIWNKTKDASKRKLLNSAGGLISATIDGVTTLTPNKFDDNLAVRSGFKTLLNIAVDVVFSGNSTVKEILAGAQGDNTGHHIREAADRARPK